MCLQWPGLLTITVPEKPSGVEVVDNLLLIWQKPDTTNGIITGYDVHITFTPKNDPIITNLDSSKLYYILRQKEIPEDATVHVQVCIVLLYNVMSLFGIIIIAFTEDQNTIGACKDSKSQWEVE